MLSIKSIYELVFNIDNFLPEFISEYGMLIYLFVFILLFCETGIFLPLPGDSLIFACAALAAAGALNIGVLMFVCFFAAFLGDMLNYYIGHILGKKIYSKARRRFIKRENIDKARIFYERHGGKAIILSRFIPIVRQFTPFVSGIGKMPFKRFITYNLIGVLMWVGIASVTGFFMGNIPAVKNNFSIVIIFIIIVSLLPAVIAYIKTKIKQTPKHG